MIRPLTLSEEIDMLPPPTEEEQLSISDINTILAKAHAMLPPEERKNWVVVDRFGDPIKRYRTQDEAFASAIERNKRAREWGVKGRYHVVKDEHHLL